MGGLFSLFRHYRDKRIILLGLDSAGKTSVLYRLRIGEVVTTIPTIGFNVEEVIFKSLRLVMWDVGGQSRLRKLWKHYFVGADALIFIVDSADHDRMDEAREELHGVLADPSLRPVPLLVLANKSDLPGAESVAQVAKDLELDSLPGQRKWSVQASSAISGDGLFEGLDWLGTAMTSKSTKNH